MIITTAITPTSESSEDSASSLGDSISGDPLKPQKGAGNQVTYNPMANHTDMQNDMQSITESSTDTCTALGPHHCTEADNTLTRSNRMQDDIESVTEVPPDTCCTALVPVNYNQADSHDMSSPLTDCPHEVCINYWGDSYGDEYGDDNDGYFANGFGFGDFGSGGSGFSPPPGLGLPRGFGGSFGPGALFGGRLGTRVNGYSHGDSSGPELGGHFGSGGRFRSVDPLGGRKFLDMIGRGEFPDDEVYEETLDHGHYPRSGRHGQIGRREPSLGYDFAADFTGLGLDGSSPPYDYGRHRSHEKERGGKGSGRVKFGRQSDEHLYCYEKYEDEYLDGHQRPFEARPGRRNRRSHTSPTQHSHGNLRRKHEPTTDLESVPLTKEARINYATEEYCNGGKNDPNRHRSAPTGIRQVHAMETVEGKHAHNKRGAIELLEWLQRKVSPIMARHRWSCPQLVKFYPPGDKRTHGLNESLLFKGQKESSFYKVTGQRICTQIEVRLRSVDDASVFRSKRLIMVTMLHEICHCAITPHNAEFHSLWKQVRDEYREIWGRIPRDNGVDSDAPGLNGQGLEDWGLGCRG